jgi:hypothetical protein
MAFDLIDKYDDCANGSPCIANQIQDAFLDGFEAAKKLMLELKLSDKLKDKVNRLGEDEL